MLGYIRHQWEIILTLDQLKQKKKTCLDLETFNSTLILASIFSPPPLTYLRMCVSSQICEASQSDAFELLDTRLHPLTWTHGNLWLASVSVTDSRMNIKSLLLSEYGQFWPLAFLGLQLDCFNAINKSRVTERFTFLTVVHLLTSCNVSYTEETYTVVTYTEGYIVIITAVNWSTPRKFHSCLALGWLFFVTHPT